MYIAPKAGEIPPLPPGSTLIADAETPLLPAESQGIQVVTCGLSPKDTFTFSSRGEDSAVVSLMRAVETTAGIVEPMEIPISFVPGAEDYPLLSTTAALVLTGQLAPRIQNGRINFTK